MDDYIRYMKKQREELSELLRQYKELIDMDTNYTERHDDEHLTDNGYQPVMENQGVDYDLRSMQEKLTEEGVL